MAKYPVDLHVHTQASDGKLPPDKVVKLARQRGVKVLGISDHDTLAGVEPALAAGQACGVEVIPAIELSTRPEPDKQYFDIHILGYYLDIHAPAVKALIQKVQDGRIEQKVRQIQLLQSMGINVPMEAVFSLVNGVPGRPHIARVMMDYNPGRFVSIQQIFDEFLADGARAHVEREFSLTVAQAISLVKEAGGLPILAHPAAYRAVVDPLVLIDNALADGVLGIEVYYPYDHSHREIGNGYNPVFRFELLAREKNLFMTGGTDYHGGIQEVVEIGEMGMSLEAYREQRERWRKRVSV